MNPQDYKRVVSNFKTNDNLQNRLKQKIVNNTKQLPFYKSMPVYRFGLMATCLIVLIIGVLVIQRLNEILTSSDKGINSSSIASNESSQNAVNNAVNSNKLQSNSAQSISSIISNSSKKSSTTQVNGTKASSDKTVPQVKGGATGFNPVILNYNHKLYNTPGLGLFGYGDPVQHGEVIGYVSSCIGERDAYSVKDVSLLDSICIPDYNSNSKYGKYDYLCDETIIIQGLTYYFTTNGQINGVCLVSNSQPQNNTNSNSNSQNNNCSYLLQLINYPTLSPKITSIVDKIIGQIPTGNVYSIDEIDPSEAIAINANNLWFLVTKEYGYSGKTINDVLNDKGIQNFAIK
jgi:hypothetical protein